ncbi:glycoside hydrolase family 13 protein [Anaerocolumna sp. MB42-C2]|uniref:glycoside hydrolase family 13 protein n=1 Tax=Anaerocolumna sp. MB42-C2 TaxID=3070997 RepID=UPI0027E19796|nr:alpha-glucosidase [Anaerocolumna sp. MB42-C2]WMJ86888.1 alpha-glucosidase [Anaerocolumna sp. MB42-C2]
MLPGIKRKWWKEAVVYQIYPRSFMDSNGDGIGDLRGIISKLDYVHSIGVDVIWLCPVYKSPNCDNGYDISDYRNIMDEFGDINDMKELIAGAHKKGIKLIMDLVANHTSDEHEWFIESRKSKDNPFRDYYIWKPAKDGKEPNNWMAFFGGKAWKYDETTGEYYLHLFADKQPDLNWENEKVRKSIYDLMNWWFEIGIDGFRMDVINMISKMPGMPNADNFLEQLSYVINGPRFHEYMQEMNREVLSRYDCMTVGECLGTTGDEVIKTVGEDRNELNMIFRMEHVCLDMDLMAGNMKKIDWKLSDFKKIFLEKDQLLDGIGWNSQFLMNHDQPRALSRFADDKEYRVESAKMLATFLLTLRGTPYIYQGEEIGMTNVAFDSIDDYRDISTFNTYNSELSNGVTSEEMLERIHSFSRDNSRTPMQWDESENAGFTKGTPWIKVNQNYKEINVAQAESDKGSIYHYYRDMIKLRKDNLVLVYGGFELLAEEDERVFAYLRGDGEEKFLVVLNFSKDETRFLWTGGESYKFQQLVISNYADRSLDTICDINLRPYEAKVYKLFN